MIKICDNETVIVSRQKWAEVEAATTGRYFMGKNS